jgi:superfamily I DNA/RNA helicase
MSDLNEEQLLAVKHPLDQPACLVAGAGSGKTRVLTERVRWLSNDAGVPPHRILCLTFTNKAAGEMVSRLGITDDSPQNEIPHVTTIHSLALSLIRVSPISFGLLGKVTPLDDYDQTQLLKKIVERTEPERQFPEEGDDDDKAPLDFWKVKDKMGFHRARGLGFASEYTPKYHQEGLKKHGGYHAMTEAELEIWRIYEEDKKKASVVDFDDMLHLCVRRGRVDADWRAVISSRYQHVLMDEAQDTNPVQWEFVNMLIADGEMNFYVVGDISQSIYAFNGAQPKLLMDYSNSWRGVVPVMYRIKRNHRSVPEIVNLANAIQRKMTETIPLKMESFRGLNGEKGIIKMTQATLPKDIAELLAMEIWTGAKKNEIPYKENCILVRSASQIRDIEGELVRLRIPYVIRGGRGFLQTEEVRDILSYLRLAVNPNDFIAFSRAVAAPRRGIGKTTLEKLRQSAVDNYGDNLITAARESGIDKLAVFVATMTYIQAEAGDAPKALATMLKLSGYLEFLRSKYSGEEHRLKYKLENIMRLMPLFEALALDDCVTIEDVVFRLTMEREEDEGPQGKVSISTIHAAKGLEWYRVYVFSVIEGYLPHRFAFKPEEVEEERRLWYVACTRAKDVLSICVPNFTQYPNSEPRRAQPSRFLYEVGILKYDAKELNV